MQQDLPNSLRALADDHIFDEAAPIIRPLDPKGGSPVKTAIRRARTSRPTGRCKVSFAVHEVSEVPHLDKPLRRCPEERRRANMQLLAANNSRLLRGLTWPALSCFAMLEARSRALWASQPRRSASRAETARAGPSDVHLDGDLLLVWAHSDDELPVVLSWASVALEGETVTVCGEGGRPVEITFSSTQEAEQWTREIRAAQSLLGDAELLAARALRSLLRGRAGESAAGVPRELAADGCDNFALDSEVARLLSGHTQPAVQKPDEPKEAEVAAVEDVSLDEEVARLLGDRIQAVDKPWSDWPVSKYDAEWEKEAPVVC